MKFAPSCAFSAVVACLLARSHGAFGSSLRSTAKKEERKLNGHEHSYHNDPYHYDPYYQNPYHHDPYHQDPYYQDPYHSYPYPAYPEPSPTERPTPRPTPNPTNRPTPHPTPVPTGRPSPQPTPNPTPMPTPVPTPRPTPFATRPPVPPPTPKPSELPTRKPTDHPSPHPTPHPTSRPTPAPSPSPSDSPTPEPSSQPTVSHEPSENPTTSEEPSENPTASEEPSENPTQSAEPSEEPTEIPEFRTIEEIICDRDEFSTFCRLIDIVGLNVVLNTAASAASFDSSDIDYLIDCLFSPAGCRKLSTRDRTTYNGSRMLQNTVEDRFFTVFAPTNTAFEEINEDVKKVLGSASGDARRKLLKNLTEFHIVNNRIIPFNGLKCSQNRDLKMRNGQFSRTACTLNGRRKAQVGIANRRVSYDCFFVPNTKCKANYPEIEKFPNRDIIASNGIIHAVDDLLLPQQFAPKTKVTEAPSTDCEGVNGFS